MKNFTLDGRLASVGKFVRQGAVFADIGTDHGYLPLSLLEDGVIERAILSDVNEGPLSSAMENAAESGLTDKCTFKLTSGAVGLDGLGITDVAIAGMGGELIADIISASPFLKNKNIRLILQPMSRQGILRSFLFDNGFKTIDESFSRSAGKYYVTMCVEYDGEKREIGECEAELGERCRLNADDEFCRGFLSSKKNALLRTRAGKSSAGHSTDGEDKLIEYIDSILN